MRAFIVRPFGTKEGINFDQVERDLVQPALQANDIAGSTTGVFHEQGNIRADMFAELLAADIVIADITIHNANVFYELGIRHALKDRHTFLIRTDLKDPKDVPFDIKTDRYFRYDRANPRAQLAGLRDALRATIQQNKADSPVFQLVPGLQPRESSTVDVVPPGFADAVTRARVARSSGDLRFLYEELVFLRPSWWMQGLRQVGAAQLSLRDNTNAVLTWTEILRFERTDFGANQALAVLYQRLRRIDESDHCVGIALQNPWLSATQRAELKALEGSNLKERWRLSWAPIRDLRRRQRAALASPYLAAALAAYRDGFLGALNHAYSGFNALALAELQAFLAAACPAQWAQGFDTPDAARSAAQRNASTAGQLRGAVELALTAAEAKGGEAASWAALTRADLVCLYASRPGAVAKAYRDVLVRANRHARSAIRRQLTIYERLGFRAAYAAAGLREMSEETDRAVKLVLVFSGHRIDAEDGSDVPRFPAACEALAERLIEREVKALTHGRPPERIQAFAGAASGGDTLFHRVCRTRGIKTHVMVPCDRAEFAARSVRPAGGKWMTRFYDLLDEDPALVRVLAQRLVRPGWLPRRLDYPVYQRNNLWILSHALSRNTKTVLITLWNGARGRGRGGTHDAVQLALAHGITHVNIDARQFLRGSKPPTPAAKRRK